MGAVALWLQRIQLNETYIPHDMVKFGGISYLGGNGDIKKHRAELDCCKEWRQNVRFDSPQTASVPLYTPVYPSPLDGNFFVIVFGSGGRVGQCAETIWS